jgi:zinc D-Ala-D-Ala dipeptidase
MIFNLLLHVLLSFTINFTECVSYSFVLHDTDLTDITKIIPDIVLDIRYATENNFTHSVLDGYEAPVALLLPETLNALSRVQEKLRRRGMSLKIFDAYRPLRAEAYMMSWALKSGNKHFMDEGYVPDNIYDPRRRICHPSGNAIDLTIVDSDGKELDMGTDFDAFTKKSWTMNAEGIVLENRLYLKEIMEAEGFRYLYAEWWHFSYPDEPALPKDIVIRNDFPENLILFKLLFFLKM